MITMRTPFSLCYVLVVLPLLSCVIATQGSQNFTYVAEQISLISSCGMKCLTQTIPAAGCSLTNTTCQCSNEPLVVLTTDCMAANCTLEEGISLSKIQANICEIPYESRTWQSKATSIAFGVISRVLVPLRLISRLVVQGKLFSDDWIILLALVVDTVFLYGGFKLEDLGYGEHIWNVDPKNLTELMQWFYVEELLYILTNGLIKISMLIFYYRLFPSHRFRIWCKVMLAFCGATTITFAFATIFQCTPLSFSWDKNIQGGYCINFVAASWAHGGVNSLQDLAILIMPIPLIWKLQMTRTKKAGLSAIFGLGTFVVVTSIMRLSTFTQFSVTNDPTWNNIPTTVWCTLEVGVAFICAAVPAIYAWMRVLFPKLRQYTSRAFSSGTGAKENSLQYPGSKRRSGLQKKHKSLYPLESMMTHGADERYSLKSTTTQEREEHAFGSAIELRGFKKDSTEGV